MRVFVFAKDIVIVILEMCDEMSYSFALSRSMMTVACLDHVFLMEHFSELNDFAISISETLVQPNLLD